MTIYQCYFVIYLCIIIWAQFSNTIVHKLTQWCGFYSHSNLKFILKYIFFGRMCNSSFVPKQRAALLPGRQKHRSHYYIFSPLLFPLVDVWPPRLSFDKCLGQLIPVLHQLSWISQMTEFEHCECWIFVVAKWWIFITNFHFVYCSLFKSITAFIVFQMFSYIKYL